MAGPAKPKRYNVVAEDKVKDRETLLQELEALKRIHNADREELRLCKVRIEKLSLLLEKSSAIPVSSPASETQSVQRELGETRKRLAEEKGRTEVLQRRIQHSRVQSAKPGTKAGTATPSEETKRLEDPRVSSMRVTIGKLKSQLDVTKKEAGEKTKLISELRAKSNVAKCAQLEQELEATKKKLSECEGSKTVENAVRAAFKESSGPASEEEKRMEAIKATVTATLKAWNSCPSYIKNHIDQQDQTIKDLQEK